MTREGELALREELARLREEVEVQLPKRLRQPREFGEASGNDDYLQILEEEAITTARINSLSRALAMARIIDPAEELEECHGAVARHHAGGRDDHRAPAARLTRAGRAG